MARIDERARYSRQLLLPEVGPQGQARLHEASILIVGAGGLGSPAALYLAAAGVGRIGIVDADAVDASNLHRQVLHGEDRLGVPKVESAATTLANINSGVRVDAIRERLTSDNAGAIVDPYDIVIDGTDNFPTRYLLNDLCVMTGKPLVYGSVDRFAGHVSLFATADGPCYRCLFPEPPPPGTVLSCAEAGVLGVMPGLIGMLQATEALKWILQLGEPLAGKLLLVDALTMRFRTIAIARQPDCPACGTREIRELIDYDAWCDGRPAHAAGDDARDEVTAKELSGMLDSGQPLVLLDVREPIEWQLAHIEGAVHVPLQRVPGETDRLDRSAEIVVYCHHGQRSAAAAGFLRQAGFPRVRNLVGGIDAWSRDVDPGVPRY